MVRVRMTRKGTTKKSFFRIIVADERSPRDGRFIEMLGTYDPLKESDGVNLKMDRVQYWLSNGAQPTDTVRSLLRKVKPAAAEASAEKA